MTTYVPDTNKDCIEKTISNLFSNQQLLNSKQNKTRSYIRTVHGIKHHDKIIENGPNGKNDQKYSKTIYSYIFLKKRYQFNSEKEAKDQKPVTTYVPDINDDCIKKTIS